MKKFTALMILDGFGERNDEKGNAVIQANTPNIDALKAAYPCTFIGASGMSVGLPDGQMGNSEVGHLNIGAGRIVYQELTRITKSIADGDFFSNEAFLGAVENVKKHDSALHLMGLLSDGGVHSHIDHLEALVRLAAQNGLKKVYVHCFMDGRDVPPDSGKRYMEDLCGRLEKIGTGRVATVTGRYYAMDRDNRWERVGKAYDALVKGEGEQNECPVAAMAKSYENGVLDEFVLPTVIVENGEPVAKISANDSVIFYNFRPDRAREITRALTEEGFDGFEREYFPLYYVCMTQYNADFTWVNVAFKPQSLSNTLGEYVASKGLKQFRIAETEKYAHVTFFFNGGVEAPNAQEDRVLIPSPKVATYDLQPEMSAYEVADKAAELIRSGEYDMMILNFANPDMVGHTGVMEAAVKAVEAVDTCVGKVVEAIKEVGGEVIITADHGNAEMMVDPATESPFTAHTTNVVPCILVSERYQNAQLREGGILADLAPTLLDLMGVEQPAEMTGKSLLCK